MPPGKVNELAAALTQLKNNPEICATMGAAGRQSFTQRFHIDSVAEKTIALYHQLIN